ncbi:hypothetical protein EX30DRAFT_72777 [Ascodesmis nigricans]|uniref:Uncharacterized protein n=1 Tax=Ascodesmis nigricans TaxID=341454 RepID=A0A4S2MTY7_9PEZI|nr:hypothetical protein EX30DRAFT_72777 [Ascodesmis nigricans]
MGHTLVNARTAPALDGMKGEPSASSLKLPQARSFWECGSVGAIAQPPKRPGVDHRKEYTLFRSNTCSRATAVDSSLEAAGRISSDQGHPHRIRDNDNRDGSDIRHPRSHQLESPHHTMSTFTTTALRASSWTGWDCRAGPGVSPNPKNGDGS